jgi:predicted dehydrogenase
MSHRNTLLVFGLWLAAVACTSEKTVETIRKPVQLLTLDPGHFHAALVQKSMYPDVDSVVHVYAPEGNDLEEHLKRIEAYNTRAETPTRWQETVYAKADFLEKMLAEKPGNVVVLAGNNRYKTEYIQKAIAAKLNVLADKPMCIDSVGFEKLKAAFEAAKTANVLLYDIMTERSEITTLLQKELSQIPEIFGQLQKGTPQNPAVTKESVHHFYKFVSGKPLKRPAWFMDVTQQGEGLVDVTTHLVDLVQWECFPEQALEYSRDVTIGSARRWPTAMTQSQFTEITQLPQFPDYLQPHVNDSVLSVYSNGEINYQLKGIHAKVSVIWKYKAPEGGGDTHFSVMRGTRATLEIKQGAEQNYKPELYIKPLHNMLAYEKELLPAFAAIQKKFAGVELKKLPDGWQVIIPETYRNGHEAHFAQVMERFLQYLKARKLPDWEVPNMLAKYYTTTKALQMAGK